MTEPYPQKWNGDPAAEARALLAAADPEWGNCDELVPPIFIKAEGQ